MLTYDSKKASIMKNIQRLRNEIEEIRNQNMALIKDLKPYESWFEDAEEIIFSSSRLRKKTESNNIKFLTQLASIEDDSSSSIPTESSDDDIPQQKNKNDEDYIENKIGEDGDDDDFIENKNNENDEDYTENTNLKSNNKSIKQKKSVELPNQKIGSSTLSPSFQNIFLNLPNKFFSNNGNSILPSMPIANSCYNMSLASCNNSRVANTKQNQECVRLNNQASINHNQTNTQYTHPTQYYFQLMQPNSQTLENNKMIPQQSLQNNVSPFRSSPKIGQIGPNSMLSNIVCQQKKGVQNENNTTNINNTQILGQVPLSKQITYYAKKCHNTKTFDYGYYGGTNFGVNPIIKITNNNEFDLVHNSIIKLDDSLNNEESTSTGFNSNKINVNSVNQNNIDTIKSIKTKNCVESLSEFNFEPSPIPEIAISDKAFGESTDSENIDSNNE